MSYTLLFFLLFVLLTVFTVALLRFNTKVKLFLLMFFAFVLNVYIRFGFGRYFTTFDESYYLFLISDRYFYLEWPFSGFVLPFLLGKVSAMLNLQPLSVVWGFSILTFVLYVPTIYWFYRKLKLSRKTALFSVLTLFLSSYYIWSGIEVRPQEVGALLGVIATGHYITTIENRTRFNVIVLPVLFVLLALSHILSFFLFSMLLLFYTVYVFLAGKISEFGKLYFVLSFSILLGLVIVLWFPPYDRMVEAVIWMVNNMRLLNLSITLQHFRIMVIIGYVSGIVLLWLLTFLLSRSILRLWNFFKIITCKFFTPLLLLAAFGGGIALYLQFMLNAQAYSKVYGGSLLTFIFFQLGNMFFGLLFIYSFFRRIRDGKFLTFDVLALSWIIIGGLMLLLSFMMPKGTGGWGFNNWLIRVLQYFPIFGAPLVAYVLMEHLNEIHKRTFHANIVFLLSTLIVVSTLNVARISPFYNYEGVITDEFMDIVSYCQDNGCLLAWDRHSEFKDFVITNFFRAYLPGIRFITGNENCSYLTFSSDSFRVYKTMFFTLTFESLAEYSSFLLRTSGNLKSPDQRSELEYSMKLLGSIYSISPVNDLECHEIFSSKEPVILVGVEMNDCTKKLIASNSLPVFITSNKMITPFKEYPFYPPRENWWNVTEGYFVIQVIENYQNTPILVIFGTDIDSTVAGIWYFVKEVYPNLIDKYANVHYIFGKWIEKDYKVWKGLKFAPNDVNGFSEGDEIEILEIN
ncbi:hypothetical protein PNA2_1118 [Pyrococcus sp. NA2]|uniref:hypothetical protein n=1 Tax=Pyrococcus sp. (strain NA2) TaxID=342949 RepID=UPI000209AB00|nr:hypothetical protein [Pyrococcus sp. NA2]AEC52034.1 hypothetical protein PNA2_1118 [Pyrococcus sp. NA2]